jgi:cation diffusion facilitator family transporter
MERFKLTRMVAIWGIVVNVLLLILKLVVGYISRSQAMIADGFNSAGDVFASVMTYTGNRISSQPEDEKHPYGHGKAEYIFSMIISFSLLLVGYKVFMSSLNALLGREEFVFSWWLIAVALFTIILKLSIYIYTSRVGKVHDNLLVLANAEDHRNDVFVTSSTLLSIILGNYKIYWVDGIVGIGISIWIAYTGIRIFISAYNVLMDTNMDEALEAQIREEIKKTNGVDHIDDVTAKPIGVGFILIVKVSVEGDRTITEGHCICAEIKAKLKNIKNVKDVVVHVNPA